MLGDKKTQLSLTEMDQPLYSYPILYGYRLRLVLSKLTRSANTRQGSC